ncbi:MAG TPA: hypothetical protein VFO86_01135, partial [Terriglobia bacterium]|nr:hypothetical protein [Terriglobia bacterium]
SLPAIGMPRPQGNLRRWHCSGGYLQNATVRPTLELILTEFPVHLSRQFDPVSGLVLIRFP